MNTHNYTQLTDKFVRWAKAQNDIFAIVMVGSRARSNPPADEHSDLDTIMYTSDPNKYSSDHRWLENFGPLIISYLGFTNLPEPEVFGLFEGMLKMDILLTQVPVNPSNSLQDWFNHSPHDVVLQHGYQILLDKTRSKGQIRKPDWQFLEEKTDEKVFLSTVKHFLFQTTKMARLLMRDELWQAHTILEQALRPDLLSVLEIEAKIRTNNTAQTWYDGRRLNAWANPQILKHLPETFCHFDRESQTKALFVIFELFEELSHNISDQNGFAFPQTASDQIKNWLHHNL